MAGRPHMTAKRRAAVFAAHDGICYLCGGKIRVGEAWDEVVYYRREGGKGPPMIRALASRLRDHLKGQDDD